MAMLQLLIATLSSEESGQEKKKDMQNLRVVRTSAEDAVQRGVGEMY